MTGSRGRSRRLARHLLIDVTPLRRSRDFRALIAGQLVSVLGNQLTAVAVLGNGDGPAAG